MVIVVTKLIFQRYLNICNKDGMATKKEEDKIVIKAFRDSSSNWWVGYKHYCLDEDNILQFVCGGIEDLKETEAIQEFIKRNKKKFIRRQQTVFEIEEKEYTKIGFGKYSQMTTMELVATDKKYASWLYKNCSDNKIKTELKELLKIK